MNKTELEQYSSIHGKPSEYETIFLKEKMPPRLKKDEIQYLHQTNPSSFYKSNNTN